MTHSGDSTLAEKRRENGRGEPWKIPFLGVGNENWGCGGNMTADYYADLYRRFAVYARNYGDNKMMRVAGGPSGGNLDWIETLMRRIPSNMEAVSLHFYTTGSDVWANKVPSTGFGENEWMSILKHSLHMETLVSDSIKIMDRHDPDGKVKLYVDEWGAWYTPEPGRNPSFLYQENTIRDAMIAALTLHIFHNHAKRVTLANLAQLVNVLQAPILTEGAQMVLTPTYHVLEMFKGHHDTTALPLEMETAYYVHGAQAIPALSASASRDAEGVVHVSLANVDAEAAVEVTAELAGKAPARVEGRVLAGEALDSRNTFADPKRVEPKTFRGARLDGAKLSVTVPPRSVVALALWP
jgi:alpha-N-arabinofuranosidase